MVEAILIEKTDEIQTSRLTTLSDGDLPEGDVTVRVAWSTLNYKDALAITGKGPVVRRFPLVPGIDLAGTVEASDNGQWKRGDRVVVNGWGLGETHWGGLAGKARLRGEWLTPLEPAFSFRQSMAIGTAGYTAMLCVLALEKHGVVPGGGPILVTGAVGGVGSITVALLSKLGFEVTAVTGRMEERAYLESLGASDVVPRSEFSDAGRPLAKERWAGAVDVAGGQVLANVCASMRYRGVVAACGLAAGMSLPMTVAPFILRGVTLVGIESSLCPPNERGEAWRRLACDLDPNVVDALSEDVPLADCIETSGRLLQNQVRGRVVVPLDGTD